MADSPHLPSLSDGAYRHPMIVWLVLTLVLLIWNAVYCSLKIAADFRGSKPANGVWGLFALAGALSLIAFTLIGVGAAFSVIYPSALHGAAIPLPTQTQP